MHNARLSTRPLPMPNRLAALTLAFAAAGCFAASPPSIPGPAFAHYASPAALSAACAKNLAEAQAAAKRLERQAPGPRWLAAYDDLNVLAEDRAGHIFVLTNVHPDKAMRDASEACELRWRQGHASVLEAFERGLQELTVDVVRRHDLARSPVQDLVLVQRREEILPAQFASLAGIAHRLVRVHIGEHENVAGAVFGQHVQVIVGREPAWAGGVALDPPHGGPRLGDVMGAGRRQRGGRGVVREGGSWDLRRTRREAAGGSQGDRQYGSAIGHGAWSSSRGAHCACGVAPARSRCDRRRLRWRELRQARPPLSWS